MSPAPSQQPSSSRDRSFTLIKEPVKEAISPSIAESLRAIFAAFLWHEGVVHDAMACASFLKFHPSLPKQGALVVTRQPMGGAEGGGAADTRRSELTKEQRARQRHSVEVSTAGNYLHIQPSTLETLTRSAANANANRNRAKKQHAEAVIKEESGGSTTATGDAVGKLSSLPETSFHTVTVLPPALKSLVYLWEELSTSCLQAIMQQVLPSPTVPTKCAKKLLSVDKVVGAMNSKSLQDSSEQRGAIDKEISSKKAGRKKKEWKPMGRANLLGDVAGGLAGAAAMLGGGVGGIERETVCELCGSMYPHPVTYHMRQAHPGCGGHAGGKGYNSGGNFCVGWAGNCGDGGVGGSSWYLVCDTCREKYLRSKKQIGVSGKDKSGSSKKSSTGRKKSSGPGPSASRLLSPTASTAPLETHIIMRNNAMFLLDLASAGGSVFPPHQQRRISINSMPSVSENYSPPDPPGPFPPSGPFQCLQALGVHPSQEMHEDQQFLEETLRRQTAQQSLMEATYNGNIHAYSSSGLRVCVQTIHSAE
jgi:E3 ubiquitin-protein ligase MYCBP2